MDYIIAFYNLLLKTAMTTMFFLSAATTTFQELEQQQQRSSPAHSSSRISSEEEEVRKTVRFGTTEEIPEAGPPRTEETMLSLWLSRKELRTIRLNSQKVLREHTDEVCNCDEYCLRGLISKKDIFLRRLKRVGARDALFQEQDFQKHKKIYDDDMLGHVYGQACDQSRHEARERGIQDQEEIQDYVHRDESSSLPDPLATKPGSIRTDFSRKVSYLRLFTGRAA